MQTETMTPNQVLNLYRDDVEKLAEYLSWLEDKSGKLVSSLYSNDGIGTTSVTFPVYDSMLMSFIKTAGDTIFMDRNYRYVYTRNGIKNAADALKYIEKASILQMDQLGGILSYYVLGGRSRSKLWSEGMDTTVFYHLVKKCKDLIDFWANAEKSAN